MKKATILTVIAALALTLGLAGCQSTTAPQPTADATSASADDSWTKVEERGTLLVGNCPEYPPFSFRTDDGSAGFDVDLANAIATELGVKADVADAPWEGLLGGVLKGDYDVLITAMSEEEAAAERVNMSDPYYDLPEVVVVREDTTDITSVDDLQGRIVGVQSGTSSEQAIDRVEGLGEIKRYPRNAEAFIDLRNGRVDAVVVGIAYAANEAENNPDLRVLPDAKVAVNPLIVVSKADGDALTEKINEALAAIKADGTYDALIEKWLSF